MSKTKPTKLTNFFEGHRRKAFLVAWTHLRTKSGESRIKLDLRVPLLNEDVIGMNEAISEAFTVMAKDNSKLGRSNLNVELDGMTLEMFTTSDAASSKAPAISSTGVKMVKLCMDPVGEDEKRQINLLLVAYVPASQQLRDWAYDHLHQEFGLEAVYSQSEMLFSPDDDDEDDDGDSDVNKDDENDGDDEDEEESRGNHDASESRQPALVN